ncbi:hypothetical protein C8R43DRAFT_1140777 [Mycena crocata]|nr:hypothetical protein C8R43DRAFT_1140777 [Mycena crocata]
MDFFPNPPPFTVNPPFTVYRRGNKSTPMPSPSARRGRNHPPLFEPSAVFRPNTIRGPPSILLSAPRMAARQARQKELAASRAAEDAAYRAAKQRERGVDLARRARRDAQRPAPIRPTPYRSPGATRVRRKSEKDGDREDRDEPLEHKDLWVGGVAPCQPLPAKPHHQCSICLLTKSHPVSYLCGHSHCYACIRLWLERDWRCPDCGTMMHRTPFRHYGEEAWLAAEYPESQDGSVVGYKWDGLKFPKFRQVIVIPDSP